MKQLLGTSVSFTRVDGVLMEMFRLHKTDKYNLCAGQHVRLNSVTPPCCSDQ